MSNISCAAPWRGLHINPRGDVKTCCAGDPNMLGNLNTQTIEEILHGPVLQEIDKLSALASYTNAIATIAYRPNAMDAVNATGTTMLAPTLILPQPQIVNTCPH